MRICFIVNPGSHGGAGRGRWQRICRSIQRCSIDWEHRVSASLEHVQDLSARANRESFEVIVAVGGDGTINRTLNGFFNQEGSRISRAKMGVIYTGTSPDFCRSYGIPLDTREALQTVLSGQTRTIGVGQITMAGTSPQAREKRYFACCANIGLGAGLARAANSGIRKYAGDRLGTFLSLLRALAIYRSGNYRMSVDTREIRLSNVHNISVGKTHYIASGIKVCNELVEGDRRFYILVVANIRPAGLYATLSAVYSGKPIRPGPTLSLSYGSVIEISAISGNDEVEFDGDPMGRLPCRIEMARDPLELLVAAA